MAGRGERRGELGRGRWGVSWLAGLERRGPHGRKLGRMDARQGARAAAAWRAAIPRRLVGPPPPPAECRTNAAGENSLTKEPARLLHEQVGGDGAEGGEERRGEHAHLAGQGGVGGRHGGRVGGQEWSGSSTGSCQAPAPAVAAGGRRRRRAHSGCALAGPAPPAAGTPLPPPAWPRTSCTWMGMCSFCRMFQMVPAVKIRPAGAGGEEGRGRKRVPGGTRFRRRCRSHGLPAGAAHKAATTQQHAAAAHKQQHASMASRLPPCSPPAAAVSMCTLQPHSMCALQPHRGTWCRPPRGPAGTT